MKLSPKWLIAFSLMSLATLSMDAFSSEQDPFKVERKSQHEIVLLNNGLASLEERLQMIERAEKTIDIEYFIYRVDKSAKIFTNALIKKAREGVKIRMLLDYFMVKSDLSPFYTHELEKYGIEIKYFNTTSSLNAFSGQYRNHRKVLLIDGKEAITGGRNIGDEYFDLSHEYNFLDRDLFVKGEIVNDIQKTFNELWIAKKSVKVAREERPVIYDGKYQKEGGADEHSFKMDLEAWNNKVAKAVSFVQDNEKNLAQEIRQKGQDILQNEYKGTCQSMIFNSEYGDIGTENRKSNRIIKHDLLKRITGAQKSVLIDSPYFIVNKELAEALDTALNKKTDVRVLTNGLNSTDAIYVYAVFDSIIKDWINKGLSSYIFKGYRPDSYQVIERHAGKARFGVHAKTFVFDNKDVVIGTYNVDPRSANYNSEMTITCTNNSELADVVTKDIEERMAGSLHLDSIEKVDEVEFYEVSFVKRLTYYLLKAPSNIFDYLL